MNKMLYTIDEAIALINNGFKLIIAADENLLKQLPKGNWIAGTIPYFMGNHGGETTKEKLLINILPNYVTNVEIKEYNHQDINTIYKNQPVNSFSILIIPALSQVHLSFALNAPNFEGFATSPLIGWISGVMLSDLGKISPKVFNGENLKSSDTCAVAMHISLPANRYAELFILNIFDAGDSDSITFLNDGFSATDAIVNGKQINFADYLAEINHDIKFPIVADYFGVSVNVSFQNIDKEQKRVDFYAPVFKGVQYKLAKVGIDYENAFFAKSKDIETDSIVFSCNCILNYLYCNLEGKHTGNFFGPITFGEIAYQLLNQTLTFLKIRKY